jgi:hypothetical protein
VRERTRERQAGTPGRAGDRDGSIQPFARQARAGEHGREHVGDVNERAQQLHARAVHGIVERLPARPAASSIAPRRALAWRTRQPWSAFGSTLTTRPRQPLLNCTVPAARA